MNFLGNKAKLRDSLINISLDATVIAIIVGLLYLLLSYFTNKFHDLGAEDFIQYWSAFQLLTSGENPYNGYKMLSLQQTLSSRPETLATMTWNPPWILLFPLPILFFSFSVAARLWFIIGLGLYLWSSLFLLRKLTGKIQIGLPILLVLLFFDPLWYSLISGQMGVLLGAAVCFSYCFFVDKKDFKAGLVFSVLSIKPHLFYLVALLVFFEIIKNKRFKIVFGFCVGMAIQATLCELIFPGAIQKWVSVTLHDPGGPYIAIKDWQVNSFVGFCRTIYFYLSDMKSTCPSLMVIIPTIFFLGTVVFLFKTKKSSNDLFPSILCISIFSTAYGGWPYDSVCLILTELKAINDAPSDKKMFIIKTLLLINFLIYPMACFFGDVHIIPFYPLLIFVATSKLMLRYPTKSQPVATS